MDPGNVCRLLIETVTEKWRLETESSVEARNWVDHIKAHSKFAKENPEIANKNHIPSSGFLFDIF